MTDEEVELVDPQQTDDNADDGSGLNLQVLTFLLVAATFVWVTGTPTLQTVEKTHWEKEVISPHEIVRSSGQMVCTDNVKHHEFWGGRYVPPDADEQGTCFMKQMKSHLQLEVYGVKLTLW